MGYKLIVSTKSRKDINKITEYIINELKNPQAADRFLDDVAEKYEHIMENPHIYASCDNSNLKQLGYRKIVIKNYLILYRIDEENQIVYVVSIVYGRSNYPEML